MKLSVVIPARNEEGTIESAVRDVVTMLRSEGIDHEVIVVDDHSSDRTAEVVAELGRELGTARCIPSPYGGGFGLTVRAGLEDFTGDAVAILMADGSDDPRDLVRYYRILMQGYDCAFGSRFMPGSEVRDYPKLKLAINRVVNLGIRLLFRHGYNDTTNAFKAYRREVIDNIQPLLSNHFNLTVEMPLKAIIRGHSYAIVPISWTNRSWGESKLALQEMGSRYLFSLLYAFLEDHLTRGDYRRPGFDPRAGHGRAPVLRLEDQPPEPVDLESRAAARGRFSR
ncbi:MAG: dolichol-phosphate mannosyltransferase [Thermoleophilaceae bacterium]|jgi:dolichol-phosphate mannosyltransferase|nr:dolichol-phosphate mannosyltransferase [Thermoleophilaceae bacterium]